MQSKGWLVAMGFVVGLSGCCSNMAELFSGAGDVPEVKREAAGTPAEGARAVDEGGDEEQATESSFAVGPATPPQGDAGDEDPDPMAVRGDTGSAGREDAGGRPAEGGDGVEAAADGEVQEGTAGEGYVVSEGDDSTLFLKMDANNDGLIEASEFRGSEDQFARTDGNGDGFIDAEEARLHRPSGRRPPDVMELDADGDGRVSRAEFPGRDQKFTRLDANGDGYIDGSEAPGQ